MKKSFSLIELLLVIIVIALTYQIFIPKDSISKLDIFTNRVVVYLNYLRYKALIDDKTDENNEQWHKKRWTMKFLRCRENEGGGVYMSIYSDDNTRGHTNKSEALKDPLTNKYITSSNYCNNPKQENSSFSILKNYEISEVRISCNSTSSLGQISFGEDGRVYSRLSNFDNEEYVYEITKPCSIKFIAENGNFREILIHPNSGYIELLDKI